THSAASPLAPTKWGRHRLDWGRRTYVMGILNVTPDSFSRDGLAPEGADRERVVAAVVEQARRMVAEGADMLDVGGESTRPVTEGAPPLPEEIERGRVMRVMRARAAALPPEILLSIDTYKASVARAALDAGASLVNDIWGLRADAGMARLLAERGVPAILMSNVRGQPRRDPL